MAISRCNKCGNVTEYERELVGITIACQCGANTTVYDTTYFVNKLSEMYFALRKEFNALTPDSSKASQTQLKKSDDSFDIHNSDFLLMEDSPLVKK